MQRKHARSQPSWWNMSFSNCPVGLLDLLHSSHSAPGVWFASLALVRDDRFTTLHVCTDNDTALWQHVNTYATLTGTAGRAMAATQVTTDCKLPWSGCPAVPFPSCRDSLDRGGGGKAVLICRWSPEIEICVAAVAKARFCCSPALNLQWFQSSSLQRAPMLSHSSGFCDTVSVLCF